MSKTNIVVNNRSFTIACDDGQEARVQQLGRYVDERFKELNQAGAAPNESYMLVLTALVIADDMFEAKDAAEKANIAAAQAGPSRAEVEAQFKGPYEQHIAHLEAELARVKREAASAQQAAQQAEQAAQQAEQAATAAQNNVTDFAEARAAVEAKEAEIARAVDAISEKLENVVKKLKRA